jgi:AraC-like DNA-binding protein
LAELEREGGSVVPILRAIGLEQRELADHERRVPESTRRQVWRMAAAASGDPYFGLRVARHVKLGTYDVVDYAAHWSSNLEDALARFVRFHRLLSDATELSLDAHRDWVAFRRSSPVSAVDAQECDSFFAVLTLRARAMLGRALRARHVRFSHASPANVTPYHDLFGVRPEFSAATNEIAFARRDLQAEARCSDPVLARILDRHAADLLARLPPLGGVVETLRFQIMGRLSSGQMSLTAAARLQGKSVRTLQRELSAQGTTYNEVVAEVRRESAIALLQAGRASLTEVAFLVGFSGTAALHRVFKRWTGTTPRQFRSEQARHHGGRSRAPEAHR